MSSSDAVPLGSHIFGVSYVRTGTVENSHTPLGDVTLYIDGEAVASLSKVKAHPGTFGLAGATSASAATPVRRCRVRSRLL